MKVAQRAIETGNANVSARITSVSCLTSAGTIVARGAATLDPRDIALRAGRGPVIGEEGWSDRKVSDEVFIDLIHHGTTLT